MILYATPQVSAPDALLLHKYSDPVAVSLRCEMGGTAGQRLMVLAITRAAGNGLAGNNGLVLNKHGRIIHATSGMAQLLGYEVCASCLSPCNVQR